MPHPNGTRGYSLFPVNSRIAYVIRDNDNIICLCGNCKRSTGPRYDVFVISGRPPSLESFDHAEFVSSLSSYTLACDTIEAMTQRAVELSKVMK